MNEAETRAEHIGPAQKSAFWGVIGGSRVLREHGITLGRLSIDLCWPTADLRMRATFRIGR